MTTKHSVKVTILGDEYTIRSATSPEETKAVAQQVDAAIREVMQAGVVETHKAAILACLRMTGRLIEVEGRAAGVAEELRALSQEIRPWLPPAKRHD